MKKRSIVIASVLKPVNDSRMTKKIGASLDQSDQWNVHVIGFGNSQEKSKINTYGFGTFKRISFNRLIAPWRILFKTISIKPDVVIITTHELLLVSVLMKLICRSKICYDVQENYYLNLLNTNAFPKALKAILAIYVRVKETVLASFISKFILAEKCYEHELPFLKYNFVTAENKSLEYSERIWKNPSQQIKLLFSGTLDTSTGVFDAIKLAEQLNLVYSIELTIIGYSPLKIIQQRIFECTDGKDFIKLIGIDTLVPHHKIMEAIQTADFGIISYPISKHTRNRIPTKLYEYLAHQLPILYDRRSSWSSWVIESQAGIAIDFTNLETKSLLDEILHGNFYPTKPKNVLWLSEEKALLEALEAI